jgi:hypothetical protein
MTTKGQRSRASEAARKDEVSRAERQAIPTSPGVISSAPHTRPLFWLSKFGFLQFRPGFALFQHGTLWRTFGNYPRNSFRGPGYSDIDLSLYKTIAIHEGVRLMIAATSYNLLNHANFRNPRDVISPGVGLIHNVVNPPSGPYGAHGGPSGRAVLFTGKLDF